MRRFQVKGINQAIEFGGLEAKLLDQLELQTRAFVLVWRRVRAKAFQRREKFGVGGIYLFACFNPIGRIARVFQKMERHLPLRWHIRITFEPEGLALIRQIVKVAAFHRLANLSVYCAFEIEWRQAGTCPLFVVGWVCHIPIVQQKCCASG